MKINKKIVLLCGLLGVVCGIGGAYTYAIQGERINENELSWIKEKMPIAHRGFDNGAIPENSIESFIKAIEKQYTIELDVVLTKDKIPVIFHDSNLERLTGDTRDVKDVTYEELKELRLEGTDEYIPTLKEVIDLVDDQVPLLIEIKNGKNAKELAEKTYEVMKYYNGRYAIQSFDPFILEHLKLLDSSIYRVQLSCDFKGEQNEHLKWYEKFVLKNLLLNFKSKPHAIAYDINSIDNLSVSLLKDKYPVITWTIKDEEQMKLGLEKSDNIIFDNIEP